VSAEPKKRSRGLWIWRAIITLLLAYSLSMGPALKWTSGHASQWQTVLPVYRPLIWMASRVGLLGDALN
jgi:hypothetical protein